VGLGTKQALQVYFPIYEFQFNDVLKCMCNNHILGMEILLSLKKNQDLYFNDVKVQA
jgi:hypothetical protein